MGEYARSLAIALAASRRWPGASIHFALSREAPYAADAPFPTTLLASSPTFHSSAVIGLLENWRPDVVIFDNAGRTVQLRAARRGNRPSVATTSTNTNSMSCGWSPRCRDARCDGHGNCVSCIVICRGG